MNRTVNAAMIGPVLHSWGGPPRSGGVSTYIVGLSAALSDLGVEISLLGDNTFAQFPEHNQQPPSSIHFYQMHRLSPPYFWKSLKSLGTTRLLRSAVRLAATGSLRIPWKQRLRYLDRAANYDKFLQASSAQILHVAHAEFRQYLCQQVARTGLPVVASVLSATIFIRPTPDWLKQMAILNYNSAVRLLPCSNFVRESIAPHVNRPDRMNIVPNGTDTEKFHPSPKESARKELGLDPDGFIILFTGSLVTPKGVNLLLKSFIKAFECDEPVRLIYVGSGPESETLRQTAGEAGIGDRVILAGYQTDESIPQWYAASDVFALPSRSEGLSGSILEAMASGKPVITTYPDLGEHDAVEQGVNGLLVRYGDADALADALLRLYTSPELVQRMGIASRQKAERHFSWQVIARAVKDVYLEILEDESIT